MPTPPSIYFVLRYHDRYGFVNLRDWRRSVETVPLLKWSLSLASHHRISQTAALRTSATGIPEHKWRGCLGLTLPTESSTERQDHISSQGNTWRPALKLSLLYTSDLDHTVSRHLKHYNHPRSNDLRHDAYVGPVCPPNRLPKGNTIRVAVENEDMRLLYPRFFKGAKTRFYEAPRHTLPAPSGIDRQMVNVTSPAVMAAQYRADSAAVCLGNKAHSRVSVKIRLNGLQGVSVT